MPGNTSFERSQGLSPSRHSQPTGKRFSLSLFRLIQIAVALGLLGFIFATISWRPVVPTFDDVLWLWIVAKLLLSVVGLLLLTVRWKILLAGQGISLPTALLFKRSWIARFVNSFLPGQIGGDLYRIFGTWGFQLNKTVVGGSVLFDRFSGLVGLLALLSVMGFVENDAARRLGVSLLPQSTLVGMVTLMLLMTTRWPVSWAQQLIAKWPPTKAESAARELLESIAVYARSPRAVLISVTISMAYLLTTAIATYVGFRALQVEVPLGTAVFISLLINVVRLIPVSINGWGLREGAYVLMFTQVGVGGAEALSVALLGRVLGVVLASIGAILYITQRAHTSPQSIRRLDTPVRRF